MNICLFTHVSVSVAQRKSWQVQKNQEKTGLIWNVRQLRQTKNVEISKMNMLVQARKSKESSMGVLEDQKILEGEKILEDEKILEGIG
jgi:hypothetical protein